MDRQEILAEINRLERQKKSQPELSPYLNEEITKLCDKLRQPGFQPRRVV